MTTATQGRSISQIGNPPYPAPLTVFGWSGHLAGFNFRSQLVPTYSLKLNPQAFKSQMSTLAQTIFQVWLTLPQQCFAMHVSKTVSVGVTLAGPCLQLRTITEHVAALEETHQPLASFTEVTRFQMHALPMAVALQVHFQRM
jgi:hypothetical protein